MKGIQKAIAQFAGKMISQPEAKCSRGPLWTLRIEGDEPDKIQNYVSVHVVELLITLRCFFLSVTLY